MKKINLDDYFEKSDWESRGRICDSPKDIAACKKINQDMEKVQREAENRFSLSAILARQTNFTR